MADVLTVDKSRKLPSSTGFRTCRKSLPLALRAQGKISWNVSGDWDANHNITILLTCKSATLQFIHCEVFGLLNPTQNSKPQRLYIWKTKDSQVFSFTKVILQTESHKLELMISGNKQRIAICRNRSQHALWWVVIVDGQTFRKTQRKNTVHIMGNMCEKLKLKGRPNRSIITTLVDRCWRMHLFLCSLTRFLYLTL